MIIFFLSTQSLLDALSGAGNTYNWLSQVTMQQVEISAVSIGQALDTIQQNTNGAVRRNFEQQLERLVVVVRSSQGVIPFDEAAAKIWADLQARTLQYKQSNGVMTELSSASRMVVATALRRGATFVESSQPYHAAISGLTVVSP
jgi:predicted nucleic acid-binding protein